MLNPIPEDDYSISNRARERTEALLHKYKLGYRLVDDFDITGIEVRSQVRSEKHVAPPERVKMFADMMKRGDSVPPGVVSNDAIPVDCNTRVMAARKIGRAKLPMFVLEMDYDDSDGLMTSLGCELNTGGAQELDKEGKRRNAMHLLRADYKIEKIAQIVGLDSSTVSGYKQEVAAVDKLKRLGFPKNDNPKALRALGRAADLHDKPFAELAKLAQEAGLNAREIAEIVKRLRKAGSDEEALAMLVEERSKLAGIIHEMKVKGAAKARPSRTLKRVIGGVLRFATFETQALVETTPEVATDYVAEIKQAISVLNRILEAQQQIAPKA